MTRQEILNSALNAPSDAILHTLLENVRATFPAKAVAEAKGHDFERFAHSVDSPLKSAENAGMDWRGGLHRGRAYYRASNGWHVFAWEGTEYEIVHLTFQDGFRSTRTAFVIAPDFKSLSRLLEAMGEWARQDRGTILAFESGCWKASEELLESVKGFDFGTLVLEGDLKDQLRRDVSQWIEARETYERYGIPWKRGIILVGEPGNGKTHAVKAIVNAFDLRCLYVRSFSSEHDTDQENIAKVFEKARESAPCVLVLEDLDTLVTPQNRSYFLNEMDGFAGNSGILTIGTANDPEKLDPALADRPSRFDRRYFFARPDLAERERYLRQYTERLDSYLRLGDTAMEVAEVTDGYSYAYLKELVLSGMMAWISEGGIGRFADVLIAGAASLAMQMRSEPRAVPPARPKRRWPGMPKPSTDGMD